MTAFDATVDRLGAALDGAEQIVRDGLVAAYHEGIADGERLATERIVAWLRGEPERLVACDGHRHADGKPCFVLSAMPSYELADAIERGEHRREGAE